MAKVRLTYSLDLDDEAETYHRLVDHQLAWNAVSDVRDYLWRSADFEGLTVEKMREALFDLTAGLEDKRYNG